MQMISPRLWKGPSEGTFIGEVYVFRDRLVPFRNPNGEINSRVSGCDKLGVDAYTTVSGKESNWHIGHTRFSFPVCPRSCSLGLSPSQH